MKILYFEGAGLSDGPTSVATIGNCRIRTAFHLDDGRAVYLEIAGSARTRRSAPEIYRWPYTGFVDSCHYITDDEPNDDGNRHSIVHRNRVAFEYSEESILRFVNGLGAGFDAIKVLPDLGGYRVFPSDGSRRGSDGYYYGDEFLFDPELMARREAIRAHYRGLGKSEGKEHAGFSLWVDEHDPGLLHLLRRFPGDSRTADDRRWHVRIDGGGTLEDMLATARECRSSP